MGQRWKHAPPRSFDSSPDFPRWVYSCVFGAPKLLDRIWSCNHSGLWRRRLRSFLLSVSSPCFGVSPCLLAPRDLLASPSSTCRLRLSACLLLFVSSFASPCHVHSPSACVFPPRPLHFSFYFCISFSACIFCVPRLAILLHIRFCTAPIQVTIPRWATCFEFGPLLSLCLLPPPL